MGAAADVAGARTEGPHADIRPMCDPVHRASRRFPRLVQMATKRDNEDERERRIEILAERLRAAEKRALLKRGIELWTRTELAMMDETPPSVAKIN